MAAASAKASINFRIHLTSLAAQTGASPGIRVKAKERVQLTTTPEACRQSLDARVRGVDGSASIWRAICQAPCRGGDLGYCMPMLTDALTVDRRMFASGITGAGSTYSRPRNSVTRDWKWWTPFSRLAENRPRS